MIDLLNRVIHRVIIWMCIPLRVLQEIYLCLVDSPQSTASHSNGDANGKDLSVDSNQKKLWEDEATLDHWWGENSPLVGLRKLNGIQVLLVAEAYLKEVSGLELSWEETVKSDALCLLGARVCDVGCGGGILAEALADAGATVTGVDMVPAAIGIAKRHWIDTHGKDAKNSPEYICKSLDALAEERAGSYDVVVCSEVLEHVSDPKNFALACCKLVRPGGCVVFTTINRTIYTLFGMIIVPEDLLGVMPRFCHRLYMCVKPEEVEAYISKMEFQVTKTLGLILLPFGLQSRNVKWMTSKFTGLGYALIAKRAN